MEFWLDKDGAHLWWVHDCSTPAQTFNAWHTKLPLDPAHWHLVKADPLTITPSILCDWCKIHGFITDGQWVNA